MRPQEIKKLLYESRHELAALEEYDRTRKLPFQKEIVSFTITRSLMEKFRKRHNGEMSEIIEKKIEELLKKEKR